MTASPVADGSAFQGHFDGSGHCHASAHRNVIAVVIAVVLPRMFRHSSRVAYGVRTDTRKRCVKGELPSNTLAHHELRRPALSDAIHSSSDCNFHASPDGTSDAGSAVLFTVGGPRSGGVQSSC
jgi:hypothetical protein